MTISTDSQLVLNIKSKKSAKYINYEEKCIYLESHLLSETVKEKLLSNKITPYDIRWCQFRSAYSHLDLIRSGFKAIFKYKDKNYLIIYNK